VIFRDLALHREATGTIDYSPERMQMLTGTVEHEGAKSDYVETGGSKSL